MLQSVKKKKIKSKSVAKSRTPLHKFPVKPHIYLGLDVGTASCGWAIVHVDEAEKYPLDEDTLKIEAGVWMFKEPVTDKERSPKNENRRTKRLERRTIRRRKIRKEKIRQILFKAGLIENLKPSGKIQDDAIGKHNAKPWRLRQKALGLNLTKDENGILETNELKKHELASVILHIAKRRGFKSNAKNDGKNDETSKMKLAMTQFQGKIHTSYAQAVHENATTIKIGNHEQRRYTNVSGDYQFTPYRDDIIEELRKIFKEQAKYHPTIITEDFKQEIETIITHVNPMQDPEKMVGKCTFYENEKRCSMSSPSYELFRFLSKLATFRLMDKSTGEINFFTPEQIAVCEKLFWKQKKATFNDIEKALPNYQFYPPLNADQIKNDITSPKGEAGKSTHILKAHLKDLCLFDDDYTKINLKALDRIAYIISFYNNTDKIKTELEAIKGLLPDDVGAILELIEQGIFSTFNKAGHLSNRAIRELIPHLRNGLKYNDAVKEIGFDFRDNSATLDPIKDIANPSAKKSVHEAFKQVRALIHKMGYRPEKIFIEMTRDIAQTKKVRDEITKSNKDNEKFNIDLTKKFQDNHNIALDFNNKEEFLAYKLWERQGGICVYSGNSIPVDFIKGNETQIDHILPFSRFLDDAQNNKVLVFTAENQRKGNQTPYEWFKRDGKNWQAFKDRIHNMNLHKRVKWALCLEPVEKDGKMIYPQESQMSRGALNATGYAVKYLKDYLQQEVYGDEGKAHTKGGTVRIFPRSGKITSLLRKSWGIEDLKKDPITKKRLDDQRHHALDAIVIATADNKTLDRLVYYAAQMREKGKFIKNAVPELEKPCTNFRRKIEDLYNNHIVVSRGEDKRARGKLHDDTLCSIRFMSEKDKKGRDAITVKRKDVSKLKLDDLRKLTGDSKNNHQLIDALTNYINQPVTESFTFNGKKKATVDLLIDGKKEKKSVFDLEEHEIDLIDNIDENSELKQALSEYVIIPKKPALVFKGVPIKKISLYDSPTKSEDFKKDRVRGGKVNALPAYRIDIFTKANEKGKKEYFMIKISKREALDKKTYPSPPNTTTNGITVDNTFEFKFSLYPDSYVRTTKKDIVREGFYRDCDIATHSIRLSERNNSSISYKGIGIKTLDNIQKFTMNRFGVLTEIKSEKRSWGLPKQ